jgi:sodium pump decarboxylase gamma subunit
MKFLELFFKGGEVTGLGMIAVFAIIAVIFLVIKGLGAASTPKKPVKAEAPAVTAAPAVAEAVPAAEVAPAQTDDLELIAVLAAAISAYTGEPVTKFRVVSFKHIK